MNDWQYLSLRDLEQNETFPKSKSRGLLVPKSLNMHGHVNKIMQRFILLKMYFGTFETSS